MSRVGPGQLVEHEFVPGLWSRGVVLSLGPIEGYAVVEFETSGPQSVETAKLRPAQRKKPPFWRAVFV